MELSIGLTVMALSIWASNQSSETIKNLEDNTNRLIVLMKEDSINDQSFQNYLKDNLGIVRNGNAVLIENKTIYNSFINNDTTTNIKLTQEAISNAIKNDYKINRAAEMMRNGEQSGAIQLKLYSTNLENETDRKKARSLYEEIAKTYDSYAIQFLKETPFMTFGKGGLLPETESEKEGLQNAINEMNDPNTELKRLAVLIHGFAQSAKVRPNCFNTTDINKWYQSLKSPKKN